MALKNCECSSGSAVLAPSSLLFVCALTGGPHGKRPESIMAWGVVIEATGTTQSLGRVCMLTMKRGMRAQPAHT